MKSSIRDDQRGLSQVMLIGLIVIVLAAVGVVGWRMHNKNSAVPKNATPAQKAAVTACQKAYKDNDLCKFTAGYDIEKLSYKMVLTSTDSTGSNTSTYLSDGKGNTSVSGKALGDEYGFVLLDGASYSKDTSDGSWFKTTVADTPPADKANPASDFKIDTSASAIAQANTTYKKIGKEACGALTCLKYQVTEKDRPDATQFFWFDTKDYRMQHYSVKDNSGSTDLVITYQAVKITAPSPTKDAPSIDTQALQQQMQQDYGQ